MRLAQRTECVEPSATLVMTARAQALRAQGVNILLMSAGEPDFDTPVPIKKAAQAAMDRGETKYTPIAGSPVLRQAIVDMTERVYHRRPDLSEVMVGTGGKQILFNATVCLLNPGDEALFAVPYWVSYPDMVRFAGGVPVPVKASHRPGALPQAQDYERHISAQTRLLILNSPSNPTGATYTPAQLEALADLLRAHPQVFIVTDDIYASLVYDAPFVSIAHVAPDLTDRILIATGVSKTYAMTGWRIGFGIGPKPLMAAMEDIQGVSTSGANSIAQAAAVEALQGDQQPVEDMRSVFKKRRDRMVRRLRGIADLELEAPQGAFYAFPRIQAFLNSRVPTSTALCEHLLEHVHLALVPGSAFGADAHIRLSFACSEQDIDEGIRRLQAGLEMLR